MTAAVLLTDDLTRQKKRARDALGIGSDPDQWVYLCGEAT